MYHCVRKKFETEYDKRDHQKDGPKKSYLGIYFTAMKYHIKY